MVQIATSLGIEVAEVVSIPRRRGRAPALLVRCDSTALDGILAVNEMLVLNESGCRAGGGAPDGCPHYRRHP